MRPRSWRPAFFAFPAPEWRREEHRRDGRQRKDIPLSFATGRTVTIFCARVKKRAQIVGDVPSSSLIDPNRERRSPRERSLTSGPSRHRPFPRPALPRLRPSPNPTREVWGNDRSVQTCRLTAHPQSAPAPAPSRRPYSQIRDPSPFAHLQLPFLPQRRMNQQLGRPHRASKNNMVHVAAPEVYARCGGWRRSAKDRAVL